MEIYDSVIIGGGFAGLSAAIYLARFNRSVIVIDKGDGRWNTHEFNENYLGFPQGISTKELHDLGKQQAKKFGAKIISDSILNTRKSPNLFICQGDKTSYQGKTLIFATGITDNFPHFPNWQEYVGKSLFWCITCDGYKTRRKRLLVIGNSDEAACDAMQFLNFTNQITFVTNTQPSKTKISSLWQNRLKQFHIPFKQMTILRVYGYNGLFEKVILSDNEEIYFDFLISEQGANPRSELVSTLGVKTDQKGYILADNEQRTNIPLLYAAGDITQEFSQQIATAVHEGSMAAQSANYDLYQNDQRLD